MSMKTKEEEYKIAIKMLIESIDYSFATGVLSQSIEEKFNLAIEYGKSVLNGNTEQVEHEVETENVSETENNYVAIQEETEPEPKPNTNDQQGTLFNFDNTEPEQKETKQKETETKDEIKQDLSKDMPFDLPEVNELNEDLQSDVKNGLLDEETATQIVNAVQNENKYFRYEQGTMYVLKPEELNIEETAPTFFANFLHQNYEQNLAEINVLDMRLDYKNHIFKSLSWTNKYGVRFQLDLVKYINFLEKYVL